MVRKHRKGKGKKYTKRVSKKRTKRSKSVNRLRSNKSGGFSLFTRKKKPKTIQFRTRRVPTIAEQQNQAICEAAKEGGIFHPEPEILPFTIPRKCDPAEFYYMQQDDPTLIKPSKKECGTPGHVLMTDPTDKGGKGYDGWMHKDNPDAICGSGYYKEDELNSLVEQSSETSGGKKRRKGKKSRKTRKKHLRRNK